MHTFTIGDVTYLPFNNSLYAIEEKVTDINDIEDGEVYLKDDTVGKMEVKEEDYWTFDVTFIPLEYPDSKRHYTTEEGRHGDEFVEANRLEKLTPDQIIECPECGAWAGKKDASETPQCFECGYGFDDEE